MRIEFDPKHIRFTSDGVGFEGFRTLVREMPDEHEAGTGRPGLPVFRFSCRPIREKGLTLLTFEEDPENALTMNRISTIMPPHNPFVLNWNRASGLIGSFEVHPRFFEEALNRAGLAPSRFCSMPLPRFVINRRVDWLCQLLMQEAEHGCPSGRIYYEHLANGTAGGGGVANRPPASRCRRCGGAAAPRPASDHVNGDQLRLKANTRATGARIGLKCFPFQPAVSSGGGTLAAPVPAPLSAAACPRAAFGSWRKALVGRCGGGMRFFRSSSFGAAFPPCVRSESRAVSTEARIAKSGAQERPIRQVRRAPKSRGSGDPSSLEKWLKHPPSNA
jgi:hypothetical protein